MAEEEQSRGSTISSAIRAERRSSGTPDRSIVRDTLVKSPQWKLNTLHKVEVERLRRTVQELEAEKTKLAVEYESELEAQKAELLSIQEAYDQFEQQSDMLLNELDQQNERLRSESKYKNKRSLL